LDQIYNQEQWSRKGDFRTRSSLYESSAHAKLAARKVPRGLSCMRTRSLIASPQLLQKGRDQVPCLHSELRSFARESAMPLTTEVTSFARDVPGRYACNTFK